MSHIKEFNTESRKGKHLTEKERYYIEALLKDKARIPHIAKLLGRDRRTIEREIKRGQVRFLNSDYSYRLEYCADTAQADYACKAQNKGPSLKIGYDHELAKYIEVQIIEEKRSPDAVIGRIKTRGMKFETSICTKTLYNYIDKGIFANISNKDLLIKRNGKIRKYRKTRIALNNTKGTSIEERLHSANTREEFGHWEMDCVLGKQGVKGAALLVLTERQTRKELIFKIKDKTQNSVIEVLNKLERKHRAKFKHIFKSVTVDNGSEFLNYTSLEKSVLTTSTRTKIYYAHPYSSWERGTNENLNKMIRRFIPKGTEIEKVSTKHLQVIESRINNYPRRIFGYQTANEIYNEVC